jgi:hypothetical protein
MRNRRNGYTKIGFTKHPPRFREKTLQSEEPEIDLLYAYHAHRHEEARLHQKFAHKRVRGEWFDLSKWEQWSVVEDEMRRVFGEAYVAEQSPLRNMTCPSEFVQ